MPIDAETTQTVEEFCKSKSHNRFWLCPSAVSTGKISRPVHLGGVECTSSTIPEEVKYKRVRTYFPDGEFICVIWENDEDHNIARIF